MVRWFLSGAESGGIEPNVEKHSLSTQQGTGICFKLGQLEGKERGGLGSVFVVLCPGYGGDLWGSCRSLYLQLLGNRKSLPYKKNLADYAVPWSLLCTIVTLSVEADMPKHTVENLIRVLLTLKALITTAADDFYKYFFIVFQRK